MSKYSATIFLLSICLISACQSEQIDNSNPVGPGDPVSFASDVQPIFSQTCGGGGCHIGTRTSGVRLDSYQNVIGSIGAAYGRLIVDPGNADGSPLVDKINANPDFGQRMPFGRAPLSGASITAITAWINDGAADN